jgi:hypothetical protein
MNDGYEGPERRKRGDAFNLAIQHSIDELRRYVDSTFITKTDLSATVAQLRFDVVRDVTGSIKNMMREAVASGIKEERTREKDEDRHAMVTIVRDEIEGSQDDRHREFMSFWRNLQEEERAAREQERVERAEERRKFMRTVYGIIAGAAPAFVIINYIGNWIGLW